MHQNEQETILAKHILEPRRFEFLDVGLAEAKTSGTKEFKQPRRLRQIKRHLKMNICAMMTSWRLLLFVHILHC